MASIRVVVTGTVQGVGFRWFTRDAADAHGVTGWVRNRRDGAVEAELHGADADVAAVLRLLRSGPAHAQVTEVAAEPLDPGLAAPSGFEIRSTD